jgi:hypothetical protein
MELNHGSYGQMKGSSIPIDSAKAPSQGNGDIPRCPIEERHQMPGKTLQSFDKVVGTVVCAVSTSETEAAKRIHSS